MSVTQDKIAAGVARYLRAEMIPKIPDKGFRVILDAAAAMMEINPRIAESMLSNPLTAAVLRCTEDGLYDVETVGEALAQAAEIHGGLPVVIPAIPLISPTEKSLNFSANDIRAIVRNIAG